MITPIDDVAAEFLAGADRALGTDRGAGALDLLGWWDLIVHPDATLDDAELRFALFALFRAQGRRLADTPALGALLAQPYVAALGLEPGSVLAAVTAPSSRRGPTALVLGDHDGRDVLVDLPGRPVTLQAASTLGRTRRLPGRLTVTEVDLDAPGSPLATAPEVLPNLRARSLVLGRIAVAAEILGTAEGAVATSTEYAGIRKQFGEPIGRFQAVRHLLAWAETDTVALAAAVRQAVWGLDDLPAHDDEVLKALAGRNGRRACERSLQVLGGIGFTAEHEHHHRHSRVLLLDSVLGTGAALTHRIGARVRETGAVPALTGHALSLGE